MRTVTLNDWGRKPYLEGKLSNLDVRSIMMIKLHMFPLSNNYGGNQLCEFCNNSLETTEHILFECLELNDLRKNSMPESLTTCDPDEIKVINGFMKHIERLKVKPL